MKRFLKEYRLHEHTEALFLLTLGMLIQVLDGSPFDLKYRWTLAWETEFPREHFSFFTQKLIQTVLSIIIVVRCMTSALYVISGVAVVYCMLTGASRNLILPWLFVAGFKSVVLTFAETLIGVYVCSTFVFAIYLWFCIRSIHKDLEDFYEGFMEEELLTQMVIHKTNIRRRRARSLVDETTLYKTANLNYFELKDVPKIIFEMLKSEDELSEDSLLSPGMMLRSVSNMGSYDYLKTSSSLGELGSLDLQTFEVIGLDESRQLPPYRRAMKFLKITKEDIKKAKDIRRRQASMDNHLSPEEISKYLTNKKPFLGLRKRRGEIFYADFPDFERELENKKQQTFRKRIRRTWENIIDDTEGRFQLFPSFHNFFPSEDIEDEFLDDEDGDDERSLTYSDETGERLTSSWFMTNVRDVLYPIRTLENSMRRSDNYARLCHEEYMKHIGSEVFEKECKLVKLTSLSDVISAGQKNQSLDKNKLNDHDEAHREDEKPEDDDKDEPSGSKKQTKKIAFRDIVQTTMPLKIILTNFSMPLDTSISTSKTSSYIRESSNSAEVITLPGSGCNSDMGIRNIPILEDDVESLSASTQSSVSRMDERERKSLRDTVTKNNSYPPLSTSSSDIDERVSMFLMKYRSMARDIHASESFEYECRPNSRMTPEEENLMTYRCAENTNLPALALSPDEEMLVRGSSSHPERIPFDNELTKLPNTSEQLAFTQELIKRPIRDILRSYYTLRESYNEDSGKMNCTSCGSRRVSPGEKKMRSSLKMKQWKLKEIIMESMRRHPNEEPQLMLTRANRNNRSCKSRNPSRNKKKFLLGEDIKRQSTTQTIRLGTPKNDKLKMSTNNLLPPLCMFGNDKSGWSSSPLDLTTTESYQKIHEKKKNDNPAKSVKSIAIEKFTLTYDNDRERNDSLRSSHRRVTPRTKKGSNISMMEKSSVKENCTYEDNQRVKKGIYVFDVQEYPSSKVENSSNASCKVVLSPRLSSSHGSTKNIYVREGFPHALRDISSSFSREIISVTATDDNLSVCSTESDESFSLFYSKTADLASPLLDMKRFIYPDHIHYSYKNVKKKGFDVELNSGLPLLVRNSLTFNPSMNVKRINPLPDLQKGITRRPMDLTFAHSEAFKKQRRSSPPPCISRCSSREAKTSHSQKKNPPVTARGGRARKSKKVQKRIRQPVNSNNCHESYLLVSEKSSTCRVHHGLARGFTSKKEHKWMKKFARAEDKSITKGFGSNRGFIELVGTSSGRLHSNKVREGVVNSPTTTLRKKSAEKEEDSEDIFTKL